MGVVGAKVWLCPATMSSLSAQDVPLSGVTGCGVVVAPANPPPMMGISQALNAIRHATRRATGIIAYRTSLPLMMLRVSVLLFLSDVSSACDFRAVRRRVRESAV